MCKLLLFHQIDDATGEQITYGSLVEKVNILAAALYDRGLRKGDVVCLYADKSILATVAVFAMLKLGAVMTPCRPSHTASTLNVYFVFQYLYLVFHFNTKDLHLMISLNLNPVLNKDFM